jgi:glycosyltransferase involved in cell wall biosynthesis
VNVLLIGSDASLSANRSHVNSQDRLVLYGKYTSKIFMVVLSARNKSSTVKRLSSNVTVYAHSSKKILVALNSYRTCCRICKENNINVVSTQDPFFTGFLGYLLKLRFKIPLNIQIHGNVFGNSYWLHENRQNYLLHEFGKQVIAKADTIRAVSKLAKKELAASGVKETKIYVCPVPVDQTKFNTFSVAEVAETRKKYGFKNGKIVLFVGRLVKAKNIPNLLKAAQMVLEEYPDTTFVLCGDGDQKKSLMSLSNEFGISKNVFFVGQIGNADLARFYQACDFFVLPSDYEGLAMVLVEAALFGKPIVATNVSGSCEVVVHGETGFLVPPRNSDQLSLRIKDLIRQPELAKSMGEKARERALAKFDCQKTAEKMSLIWKKTSIPVSY